MIFQPIGPRPTVVRLRPTSVPDSYGDPVESWDVPERTVLRGAFTQDRDSLEVTGDGRTRVVTRRVLYAYGDAALTAADRVEVDGVVHLIDGEPAVHRSRTRPVYTSASLVRPTG